MELRDYQHRAINGLFTWWQENGATPALVVLPTGSGKTIVFSTLIASLKDNNPELRVLVLAHTKELVKQAADKLLSVRPDMADNIGIYAAGLNKKNTNAPITIASRDSIANALAKFEGFDLVIIDEAHLVNIKDDGRYRKILNWNLEQRSKSAVIGFTATPYRQAGGLIYGDERLFKGVACDIPVKELINAGYLAKLTAKAADNTAVIDTRSLKVTGGDFNQRELQDRSANKRLVSAAVGDWLRKSTDRKASCFFAVGVDHAQMIYDELTAKGITARMVTGNTPDADRDQALAMFERGELPALVNVACLTTGWDAPILDCLVVMRPTRSLALWLQIVGRGLRLYPDKQNALILDYGGNLERFGPIDSATPPISGQKSPKMEPCTECGEMVSVFARRCPSCSAELNPTPSKDCKKCGTTVHVSAKKCPVCGELFLSDDLTSNACNGVVISKALDHRLHRIENVSAACLKSKRGTIYCRVTFWESLTKKYTKNLMIGLPGRLGVDSLVMFYQMLPNADEPANAGHAAVIINTQRGKILDKIGGIVVDHRSRFLDVIQLIPKVAFNKDHSSPFDELEQ